MKIIKSVVVIFLIFIISATSATVTFAHSGRTDSKGGHYDHQSGGYHYHHGYPAHSHSDGECPYEEEEDEDEDEDENHKDELWWQILYFVSNSVILVFFSFPFTAVVVGILLATLKVKDENFGKYFIVLLAIIELLILIYFISNQ